MTNDGKFIQSTFPFSSKGEDQLFPSDLLTVREAVEWASDYIGKSITPSNISYLVQYGLVKKFGENNSLLVSKSDLINYYNSRIYKRQEHWNHVLGQDLDWHLSFENVKEAETTKHVHRLHPYKGKFIPQLVEYFLNAHTDEFKTQVYFKSGDIVLDPFCGSGTTLVQSNELGIHGIGIDISEFNTLISNIKVQPCDFDELRIEITRVTREIYKYFHSTKIGLFDKVLLDELRKFNNQYFPTPGYRYSAQRKEINPDKYGAEKSKLFEPIYDDLINKYQIVLRQPNSLDTFLGKWFLQSIRNEIDLALREIEKTPSENIKNILRIILSRTIRSCRATTHSDLATLIDPIISTYYCPKHFKICKPLFTITEKWTRYSTDTLRRLIDFSKIRTNTYQLCITGDSRNINLLDKLETTSPNLYQLVSRQKIRGIFSSPPYVGLIDYHEQHAYAYELFKFNRNDNLEIGPLFLGRGRDARESYVKGIVTVLKNCKSYLDDNYDVLLVANDKYSLYPQIAEMSGMEIVNEFKRPVLNRSERDKSAYSETIFHIKDKNNAHSNR